MAKENGRTEMEKFVRLEMMKGYIFYADKNEISNIFTYPDTKRNDFTQGRGGEIWMKNGCHEYLSINGIKKALALVL